MPEWCSRVARPESARLAACSRQAAFSMGPPTIPAPSPTRPLLLSARPPCHFVMYFSTRFTRVRPAHRFHRRDRCIVPADRLRWAMPHWLIVALFLALVAALVCNRAMGILARAQRAALHVRSGQTVSGNRTHRPAVASPQRGQARIRCLGLSGARRAAYSSLPRPYDIEWIDRQPSQIYH